MPRADPRRTAPGARALRSTTILLVRHRNQVCMAADGQVTNAATATVIKHRARKLRRASAGRVLVGFAGGAADALALYVRLEGKLESYQGNLERAVVELAQDWRSDRVLRRLEAQMIAANAERAFLVMGNGDLLEPDDGLLAIGSGATAALAAARALVRHADLDALAIARAAMTLAAELCVYTNDQFTFETL